MTRVSPGPMATACVRSISCRRLIFCGLVIALKLTKMSLPITRGRRLKFMLRLGVSIVSEVGMFWWTHSLPKSGGPPWNLLCWHRVQIRLFLLLLVGGGLVWESIVKAEMLSAHFDGNQPCYPIDLPSTCHPSPSLTTFASRALEARRHLLDLGSFSGTDRSVFFFFLKWTADALAPNLTMGFRRLLRLGSFPVWWRVANVTSIPKGPPFFSVAKNRPNFLNTYTVQSFWSVWCRFVLVVLWNAEVCFQLTSSLIGKSLH